MLLHPGDKGRDRRQLNRVIPCMGGCAWASTAPPQCGQVLAWAMMTWSGSGCRGRPPPARPTLASRRVPVRGPLERCAFGVCAGGTHAWWASLRGACGLASSASSRAFSRCTSTHHAAMSASFSDSERRPSSGSLSMAALSSSPREKVKRCEAGVEQLPKIFLLQSIMAPMVRR